LNFWSLLIKIKISYYLFHKNILLYCLVNLHYSSFWSLLCYFLNTCRMHFKALAKFIKVENVIIGLQDLKMWRISVVKFWHWILKYFELIIWTRCRESPTELNCHPHDLCRGRKRGNTRTAGNPIAQLVDDDVFLHCLLNGFKIDV